jgi:TM2 domain-containing membrane protein YozV
MKKAVKAALWSAFAFPGVGHFMVRHAGRGLALMGIFAGLTWYLVDDILSRGLIEKTNDVVNKMLSGEVPADSASLERMLNMGPDPLGVQIASWALFACWIAGIVDSYRLGDSLDKAAVKPDSSRQTR